MNAKLEQITQDALRLAPNLRAELADFLVESLGSSPTDEIQKAWLCEADQRLDEVRSGKVRPIPGEDVLAEARRLVKR